MGARSHPSPNSINGLYRASLMANDSARESFLMCSAVPSHNTAAAGALGMWARKRTNLWLPLNSSRPGAVVEGKTSQPQKADSPRDLPAVGARTPPRLHTCARYHLKTLPTK